MADSAPQAAEGTYLQRLKHGEQHVFWKLSFRIILLVANIIAIGLAAWDLANVLRFHANPYLGIFSGAELAPFTIAANSLSFILCLVMVLVLMLRQPPKAAHPGIAVGCDLVLWLAFVGTALSMLFGVVWGGLKTFGNDGRTLSDPSGYYANDYSGEYYLAPNNTWIYNITSVSPYYAATTSSSISYNYYGTSYETQTRAPYGSYFYNSTRGTYQLNNTEPNPAALNITRDCSYDGSFTSCAEQDAYINNLWHTRDKRYAIELIITIIQWLNLVLHFVLFVWACVDTHKRNQGLKQSKVNAVAEKVISDMQARGLITVHTAEAARRGGPLPEGQPLMAEHGRDVGMSGGAGASTRGSAEAGPSSARR